MKRLAMLAIVFGLFGLVYPAPAADKPNPTGTWKWEVKMGDQTREFTLKLKLEKGTLTGAMVRTDQETPIQDGKFKDGKVSFTVTRERDGQKFTIKYSGKVEGDTIKGKSEFEREGEKRTRDWEAKRVKS